MDDGFAPVMTDECTTGADGGSGVGEDARKGGTRPEEETGMGL